MKKMFLAALLLFIAAGTASASYSYTNTDSYSETATNWSSTLSVDQFNVAGATLESIVIELGSSVTGEIRYESLDSAPSTVTAELRTNVTMDGPNGYDLAVSPMAGIIETASAFDGVIDFGLTSGNTLDQLSGYADDSVIITNVADFAAFIGNGTVDFDISATGASTGSGPGNLLLGFRTFADADVKVTYNYVPEPATLAMLSLGGLALIRRKK